MITFDADLHVYRRVADGARVPSVTDILRATRISIDFDALATVSDKTRDAIDAKRDLGSVVHADCHALDDRDLDWATIDPRSEPYVRAWETCCLNMGFVPLERERRVYEPTLGYAGTFDGIVSTPKLTRLLIDLKIGDPEDAGCRYQTALYQLAYEATNPGAQPIDGRMGIWLRPDLKVPYRLFPYDDWRDREVARAIVTTFWAQPARRRAAA